MSDVKMSDIKLSDFNSNGQVSNEPVADAIVYPPCPLCGAKTVLIQKHKAVEATTNVFCCTICRVQYPVAKKAQAGA